MLKAAFDRHERDVDVTKVLAEDADLECNFDSSEAIFEESKDYKNWQTDPDGLQDTNVYVHFDEDTPKSIKKKLEWWLIEAAKFYSSPNGFDVPETI